MLAVLAPGLRERLELDVSRLSPKATEIVAYCVELGQVEGEGPAPLTCEGVTDPLLSKPGEFCIVEVEVDGLGCRQLVQRDEGCDGVHSPLPVFFPGFYVHAVHEGVGKRGQESLH
ncbi:MAG: hypothetical protein A4E40_01153 [Methanoregulaceae archaeon PtaU1.Bin059]|nr:MAG: hypothetical protein A4E40_01153 [Methanoregulaceae archaeon PtaU1.Bin059]